MKKFQKSSSPATTRPLKQSLTPHHKPKIHSDSTKKIKLLCSFGGSFLPRSSDGKLRYSGGETRIVSIPRNAGISQLRSKMSELSSSPTLLLKYQLPFSAIDTPLVSVSTDEDVLHMIDEHDMLESDGKPARLRLFLCEDSGYVGNQFYSESRNLASEDGKFLSHNRKIPMTHVAGTRNSGYSLRDVPPLCRNQGVGEMGTEGRFRKLEDDSSSPPVLRFAPSNRIIENFANVDGVCVANPDQSGSNVFELSNQAQYCLHNYQRDLIKSPNSVIGYMNRENIMPWSHESNATGLPAFSCGNRSVGHYCSSKLHINHNGFVPNSECRTGNHRISLCDIRNHRNNACNIGHHQIGGFDGRSCTGLKPKSNVSKFRHARSHFGRPCYDIHEYMMEQRMVKIVEPSGKRTQPLFNIENSKGIPRNWASYQRNGRKLHDQDGQIGREIETCPGGETNLQKDHFSYFRVPHGFSGSEKPSVPIKHQSHSIGSFIYNPIPRFGEMTVGDDVLCYLGKPNLEIPIQTMCNNPFIDPHDPIGIDLSFHDLNVKPSSKESPKRSFNESPKRDLIDLGCNDRCSPDNLNTQKRVGPCKDFEGFQHKDFQAPNSDFVNVKASSCSIKPSVDLYIHNQSVIPLTEFVPPTLHSSQKNYRNFSLEQMDVASSNLDISAEKVTKLGTPESDDEDSSQKVSVLLCPSATQVSSKSEKDLALTENRQTMQEKDNAQGYGDCSKIDSIVNKDDKIVQTCLATSVLQTINNSDLEEIRTLGSGTYGTVFYGKWKGCDVAIKRIKPSCFSGDSLSKDRLVADFWREAHILGQLHHPNVVAFYGVVRDEQITNLATVTEYMVNGSLKQVLQKKDRTIDRRKRLIIAMDAAFGMEYLHEKNIVHFDLKSHNFLVNMKDPQRPVCKIGDLGLSKVKQNTLVSGGVRGTLPWMAPELLSGKSGLVSEKIDVYSFGIVLWELLTGEEPYANMRSSEIIGGIINDGIRPEIPHWCDPMWRSLMERCWSSDPDSRPAFSEIAKELRAMSASMNIK